MSPIAPRLGSRALFPDLNPPVYAHHAAIAPVSAPVSAAVSLAVSSYAEQGAAAYPRWHAQRERLRQKLAGLINAKPGTIALTQNTSRGVSDVALSIPWKPGDRVILFKGEFPANVTPWQRASDLFQLELCWHDAWEFHADVGVGLERLEHELKRGARLVAVSTVQFQSGLRMPVETMGELCGRYGYELFVDAIQSCGLVPLDVQAANISYLSTGGHKWLMGMEGAGFVYVDPEAGASLRPYVAGWLSHEEPADFLFEGHGHLRYDRPFKANALVFEGGTYNVLGAAALEAAVDLLQQLGVSAIFEHVSRYLDQLEVALVERGFRSLRKKDAGERSGILSLEVPHGISLHALHQELLFRGIVCGKPDGLLRFSPHWPNSLAEVEAIAAKVDECLELPSLSVS